MALAVSTAMPRTLAMASVFFRAMTASDSARRWPRSASRALRLASVSAETFERASQADLEPQRYDNTLAFMFETRYVLRPTKFALETTARQKDYYACWQGLKKNFSAR